MKRGVVFTSINSKQLTDIYLKERFKERTNIPHQGITYRSYDTLIKQLKNWLRFIEAKKLQKKNIEDIPTEFAIGFGEWLLNRPKDTYTNERYKGTERSRQTINSNIAAVKKMYKDIAITQKIYNDGGVSPVQVFKGSKGCNTKERCINRRRICSNPQMDAIQMG